MPLHTDDQGIAGSRRLAHLTLVFIGCLAMTLGAASVAAPGDSNAKSDVEREVVRVHGYFLDRFPDVPLDRYGEGAALIGPIADRPSSGQPASAPAASTEDLYTDCLPENARAHFPRFDAKFIVVTLRQAINDCRAVNGEPRLDEADPALDRIEAAVSQKSAGKKLEIPAPAAGSQAQSWFDKGRFLFSAKRGRQNLSCANCHEQYAGSRYEESVISANLSHALRFPGYSTSKKELISLHEQYAVCSEREGAQAFALQSDEYKALEYYQSVIASGLPLAAPATLE